MTTAVRVSCPAKINLYLRILAREDSGYHQIESVFQGIDLCDQLHLEPSNSGVTLSVESEVGPTGDLDTNTVMKAARLFFEHTGLQAGVRARLEKNIPMGTGLGGGSSDAAGALLGLNRMFGEPLSRRELVALGGTVGADVPFFCTGAPTALAWGRGGRILPQTSPPEAYAVVCIPNVRVSTAEAYKALAGCLQLPPPAASLGVEPASDWEQLGALQHNDFEAVVFQQHDGLSRIRQALEDAGAVVARMTGSGSAIFGVFGSRSEANRASREMAARDRIVQVVVAATLSSGPLNRMEEPR